MYAGLGAVDPAEQVADIEWTLAYMAEDVRKKGNAAVSKVSYLSRSAAQRWVNNINGLVNTYITTLTKKKNGVPFFAREPASAQRLLREMSKDVRGLFGDLNEASDDVFIRALTAENLEDSLIQLTTLIGQKVGVLVVAAGSGAVRSAKTALKKDPTNVAPFLLLGGGLAVAYIVRSFRRL